MKCVIPFCITIYRSLYRWMNHRRSMFNDLHRQVGFSTSRSTCNDIMVFWLQIKKLWLRTIFYNLNWALCIGLSDDAQGYILKKKHVFPGNTTFFLIKCHTYDLHSKWMNKAHVVRFHRHSCLTIKITAVTPINQYFCRSFLSQFFCIFSKFDTMFHAWSIVSFVTSVWVATSHTSTSCIFIPMVTKVWYHRLG